MVDGLMALGNLLSSLSQHRLRNRVNSSVKSAGSEVAHQVASVLATVRRSNVVCRFPAPRFHEGACCCAATEGISFTSCTNPYSPYSLRFGSCFQPQLRQRLYRCDQ